MMTAKLRKCYTDAMDDTNFVEEMVKASTEGNKKPGFFSSEIEKCGWALAYYGYYLGKYGVAFTQSKYP